MALTRIILGQESQEHGRIRMKHLLHCDETPLCESTSTSTSSPATRTGKLSTPCRAGGVNTEPGFTLNREPCQGQMTSSPAISHGLYTHQYKLWQSQIQLLTHAQAQTDRA